MKLFKPKTIWWPTWQGWMLLFLIFAGLLVAGVLNIHGFLAVTNRVESADILVVEAWVPELVIQATVKEFKEGQYRFLLINEMRGFDEQDNKSHPTRMVSTVNRFVSFGIPKDRITECFTPATNDHRSAAMAGTVRDTLMQRGINAKGFNVVAPATHARKTWLLYRRALAPGAPVGIIAVPTGDYDPSNWWKTTSGANWVIVNGIGWFYEWTSGL